jgi:hypothetical protein
MGIHIRIEQLSDHSLVLRPILGCMRLEKLDASLAQGDSYLYTFIAKRKLVGWGKKIRYNPKLSQWFIRVLCFRVHRSTFLYASILPQ